MEYSQYTLSITFKSLFKGGCWYCQFGVDKMFRAGFRVVESLKNCGSSYTMWLLRKPYCSGAKLYACAYMRTRLHIARPLCSMPLCSSVQNCASVARMIFELGSKKLKSK